MPIDTRGKKVRCLIVARKIDTGVAMGGDWDERFVLWLGLFFCMDSIGKISV